jgi:hypothetical protein
MGYMIAFSILIFFLAFLFIPTKNSSSLTRLQPVAHQERRGGPIPVNPAKQAACKAARDAWLSNHGAVSAGSTKRGDVYLCHGETSEKAL